MLSPRIACLTLGAAALLAGGGSTAAAAGAGQDLRSPDARDAASAVPIGQDLRSPDAREAASAVPSGQDLRSPDARDVAALAQERYYASQRDTHSLATQGPDRATTSGPARTVAPSAADGFHWSDAAVGAGGTLGVVLLVAGTGAVIARRRLTAHPATGITT